MRKPIVPSNGIEQSLLERVLALPSVSEKRMRKWTPEEDEALIKGMDAKKSLRDISRLIGVNEATARERYRTLTEQKTKKV